MARRNDIEGMRAYLHQYYINNKEKYVESKRRSRAKYNSEKIAEVKAKNADYREINRAEIRRKGIEYYYKTRGVQLSAAKTRYLNCRIEALQRYSFTDNPACCCCGEDTLEFLAIDHMNGNGAEHRREVGEGVRFVLWLRRNNYPVGYQVLCHNCNFSKGTTGYCIHERLREKAFRGAING